ncbi:hypothetical protein ACJX0J_028028 [Zea mays]
MGQNHMIVIQMILAVSGALPCLEFTRELFPCYKKTNHLFLTCFFLLGDNMQKHTAVSPRPCTLHILGTTPTYTAAGLPCLERKERKLLLYNFFSEKELKP